MSPHQLRGAVRYRRKSRQHDHQAPCVLRDGRLRDADFVAYALDDSRDDLTKVTAQ